MTQDEWSLFPIFQLLFLSLFKSYICLYLCVYVWAYHSTHMEVKGLLCGLSFLLSYVGPRD